MSDMDRRAFVGAAALGGVAAAVLTSSSVEAAGDNSGYFVIAEIVSTKESLDAHMVTPEIKEIVPKLQPILAKPVTQIFLDGRTGV